jgi:hypothetical protein
MTHLIRLIHFLKGEINFLLPLKREVGRDLFILFKQTDMVLGSWVHGSTVNTL